MSDIESKELPRLVEIVNTPRLIGGYVIEVHYANDDMTETEIGRTVYDVIDADGGVYMNAVAQSLNGEATQYNKLDPVLLYIQGVEVIIIGGNQIGKNPPTQAGESGKIDPQGGAYTKTNAAKNSFASASGVVGVTVEPTIITLHPDNRRQKESIDIANKLENLSTLSGPLLAVVMSALEPLLRGATAEGLSSGTARIMGLQAFDIGVSSIQSKLVAKAGKSETSSKALKIVAKIMKIVNTIVREYRPVIEQRTVRTKMPTASEIRDKIEKRLKDSLPSILVELAMSAFDGKRPSYKVKIDIALRQAQNALMPVVMEIISQAIGG